eukprot:scaffold119159_cov57-Phaeocystis_antarctica.AAC.1
MSCRTRRTCCHTPIRAPRTAASTCAATAWAAAMAAAMVVARAAVATEAVAKAVAVAAMAAAERAAVAKVVATAAAATAAATAVGRTPRPHSSAQRADLRLRNSRALRCCHPVPLSGSPLLASAAFPLPAGRAEAASVVAALVVAKAEGWEVVVFSLGGSLLLASA